MSLFRGGSDVLFHPRQRQSCRTAKTYHTIVSKFAHSLISRSFSSAISLSSFLFLSRRFFFFLRWLPGGSLYLFIYSRFTSSLTFFFLVLFVFLYFTSFTLFIVARLYHFISRIPSVRGGVSWYAPAKFFAVPFARRTGRHRVKCAPLSFTAVGIAETIVENDPRAPVNVQVIKLFISLVRIYRCKSLSE